jgi:hypothetical protein
MGFYLEKYFHDDYENDGDNGGGGDIDADVATVGGGGGGGTKGNGNDSLFTSPQLVSLGWDDMIIHDMCTFWQCGTTQTPEHLSICIFATRQ